MADSPGLDEAPSDLAEAGAYPTPRAAFDRGLVVLAMGLPFWLVPAEGDYRLLVEARDLGEVREQLALFERESVCWPPKPPPGPPPRRNHVFFTPLLWALAVLAAFAAQNHWPGRLEASGDLNAEALFGHGEWWRPATALFLHAGLGHLTGNLVAGIFIFAAVVSSLGTGRGWLLIALSALAGNTAAAALNYPGPYESLGASTAIFAGLGLLTGSALRAILGTGPRPSWRAGFLPLAAGLSVLGLYGAGGIHTDVAAHAAGFGAGLILGCAAAGARRNAC